MFPRKAFETVSSIRYILCGIVDSVLLADFNEDQVEKLLTLLDLVPLNKGREDEKGFIARRMCMRDDCTPVEDHGFIKVAMERTIPKLRDDIEKNFNEIQLAVSLLNHSKNQSEERAGT